MWKVKFSEKAAKQFARLPRNIQQEIAKAIDEKLLIDPDFYLPRLSGLTGSFYRFRVGDYRLGNYIGKLKNFPLKTTAFR